MSTWIVWLIVATMALVLASFAVNVHNIATCHQAADALRFDHGARIQMRPGNFSGCWVRSPKEDWLTPEEWRARHR